MPTVCSAVMAAISYFFYLGLHTITKSELISLIITIVVAACIYFFLMILTKTLSEKEIYDLPMGGRIVRLAKMIGILNAVKKSNPSRIGEMIANFKPSIFMVDDLTVELADAIKGADVFIGVSAPKTLTPEMVCSMAENPIIFAMANPEPDILPELAKEAGAAIVGTGRSDYPNQINNVLVFPGLFKGALEAKASRITEEMKVAAAYALAGIVSDQALSAEYILPKATDKTVGPVIAAAVRDAWKG